MPKPNADHLIAELETHGVTQYRIDRGGKHPRLVFTWRNREMFYVFPATPGDSVRGDLNGVANLRRLMGVERVQQRKSAQPRKPRPRRVQQTSMPDDFLVRPDPWQALAAMRERMQEPTPPAPAVVLVPAPPILGPWRRFLAWVRSWRGGDA